MLLIGEALLKEKNVIIKVDNGMSVQKGIFLFQLRANILPLGRIINCVNLSNYFLAFLSCMLAALLIFLVLPALSCLLCPSLALSAALFSSFLGLAW